MIEHSYVTIHRRGCFWLLLALGLAAIVPRAVAAGPGLLDYFQACGVGDDAFAKFADDRQIAEEELDVIRRIAVRLRDCPAERLQRMMRQDAEKRGRGDTESASVSASPRLRVPVSFRRGQMFELQGSLVSVEPVEDPGGDPLWRCVVALSESSHRAVVYVAEAPERLRTGRTSQRVVVDGVFVKYMPGVGAEQIAAVIVAPRLQWRPETPLGNLGMDFGLFEGISDNFALTAADHDAFYRLLQLARSADPDRLRRDAERLDASSEELPALFRDPAAGARGTPGRGRLVRLSGTARRAVRVPIDDPAVVSRLGADHYFEIDLVTEGSQNNPLVFCTLDLPDGMPAGEPPSYGESIEATGFFLKNWEYPTALSEGEKAANPGSSRALQVAPLLIGPSPLWKPGRPVGVAEKKSSTGAAIGGLLALAVTGVCLLLWSLRQADQDFFRQVIAR